ncbi:glycosyltransferase [Subtercola sp. YIM 133946]|uniref:glycosyltransferase n=1 Tax=Subtercola sp. YIM 133946 TaxID=3118909 RepID=UPI002F9417F1
MHASESEERPSKGRPTVLIYTTDVVAERMAGPGIRAMRFAEALAPVAEVRLVAQHTAELRRDDFVIDTATGDDLLEHIRWADVVIVQYPIFSVMPEVLDTDTIWVVDLYDPFLLEQLQQGLYIESTDQVASARWTVDGVNEMLLNADFIICASEKQRDMWIGQLSSLGRLNPQTYRADPSLRNLIDVVPFGVDEAAPVKTRPGIRGVVDGISETDRVLLWGGGIYDWFDPLTLIRAVAQVSARHDDLRLFFLATQNANPLHGTMKMATDAIALADELGVLGRSVFFNETWVPHTERANYFLDADVGVSTHLDHLETAFSFRTRLLDYLWAGLPIINSAGDAFERDIVDRQLGAVVAPGDVGELAAAIEALLYDEAAAATARRNVEQFAPALYWSHATRNLVRFCTNAQRAADAGLAAQRRVDARSTAETQASQLASAELARQRAVDVAEAARAEAARLAATADELRARVGDLEASTSWRVTAPLRAVTRLVKR